MKEEPVDLHSEGDENLMGFNLLAKYFPKGRVIEGADHDVIYSKGVDDIVEAGITEEDAIMLRNLGFILSDDECYIETYA
jgi:hypothetical protein